MPDKEQEVQEQQNSKVKTPATATPSPAALAKKSSIATPVAVKHDQHAVADAQAFGRVSDDGTVFVKEGDSEREVGQFPDASKEEALQFYAQRFLDLQAKVNLFAQRLRTKTVKINEINSTLKSLQQELVAPAVVGNLKALNEQFAALQQEAEQKKEAITKAHKEALAKAAQEREAIVERAEQLAAELGKNTRWSQVATKFQELFDEWQQHQKTSVRLDRATADALWKRFSAARSTFNTKRHEWVNARNEQREHAKQVKTAIVEEAEKLKNSTQWVETSHAFNKLMDQWKATGRAGNKDDDALWAKFRAAADVFFAAREENREQVANDEQENLKKKLVLVEQAEALLPVSDVKAAAAARKSLAKIQDEWDEIGRVPRSDMRTIEARLSAVEQAIKDVETAAWEDANPETDARKSSFAAQLEAQLQELDAAIAKASSDAEKKKLEAEKAAKEQWLGAIR